MIDKPETHGVRVEAIIPAHIPSMPVRSSESKHELNPASWMYERVCRQIIDFEKSLKPDEELGGRFVNAPHEGVVHVEDVGYWGPDMLIFHGTDNSGRPVQLLQHYSQTSVLLCTVPKKDDQAKRIGFVLESRLANT